MVGRVRPLGNGRRRSTRSVEPVDALHVVLLHFHLGRRAVANLASLHGVLRIDGQVVAPSISAVERARQKNVETRTHSHAERVLVRIDKRGRMEGIIGRALCLGPADIVNGEEVHTDGVRGLRGTT